MKRLNAIFKFEGLFIGDLQIRPESSVGAWNLAKKKKSQDLLKLNLSSTFIYVFLDQIENFYFPSGILLNTLKCHSWLWAKHKMYVWEEKG